mmetsp:Transcript_96/g.219  ORF Transcript_96/g.219 Transcript_96/m.219 type:complete len:297 (+) Transcript_96:391-1281(+)
MSAESDRLTASLPSSPVSVSVLSRDTEFTPPWAAVRRSASLEQCATEHNAKAEMEGEVVNTSKSDTSPAGLHVPTQRAASVSPGGGRRRRMSLGRRRKSQSGVSPDAEGKPAAATTAAPAPAQGDTSMRSVFGHEHNPSTASSHDFTLNGMWKSDEMWVDEAAQLESEIVALNMSFNRGQLQAFGHSAAKVYDNIDKLRREQFDLFEQHAAFEADILADLGKPLTSAANMQSKGFDVEDDGKLNSNANKLMNSMNGVCSSIQAFTTTHATRVGKPTRYPIAEGNATSAAAAAAPSQ